MKKKPERRKTTTSVKSRLRNSIKIIEGDGKKESAVNSDTHYGGDKYGSAVNNHTAKNWGFATGFKSDSNVSDKPKKKKKGD